MAIEEQKLLALEKRIILLEELLREKSNDTQIISAVDKPEEIKVEKINEIEHANHQEKKKRITVKDIDYNVKYLQEETHGFLSLSSLVDFLEIPIKRYLPVKVFIKDYEPLIGNSIIDNIINLVSYYEFEIADEYPEQIGSWFKKVLIKSKEVMTQPEVREKLEKVEHGLEVGLIKKTQSEIDRNQAEAASTMIKSLESVDNAACQIGSILVIKTTSKNKGTNIYVRTLTTQELILIEKDQTLLIKPDKLLQLLNNPKND